MQHRPIIELHPEPGIINISRMVRMNSAAHITGYKLFGWRGGQFVVSGINLPTWNRIRRALVLPKNCHDPPTTAVVVKRKWKRGEGGLTLNASPAGVTQI
jgi:hypothetical protein